MKIPSFIHHCFWSYDISSLDVKENKKLIIEQVLNYGDWQGVRWLFKTYPEREIKKVIEKGQRGIWEREVLNFWTTILKVRLPRDTYNLAIREIDPAKVDRYALQRFFKRIEEVKK